MATEVERIPSRSSQGAASGLRAELRQVLNDLRQRIRRYVLIDGLGQVLIAIGFCFWGSLLIDYLLELPWLLRMLLLVGMLLFVLRTVWTAVLGRYFRGLKDRSLALVLERRFPQLDDRLVTSVEMAGRHADAPEVTQQLLQRTVDEVTGVVQQLDLKQVFDQKPLVRTTGGAVAAVLSMLIVVLAAGGLFRSWADRNLLLANSDYPRSTVLELYAIAEPGERPVRLTAGQPYKHPRGADLVLRAEVPEGRTVPSEVRLTHRLLAGSGGRREFMTRQGERRFQASLSGLTDSVNVWLRGGDSSSRTPYLIEIVDAPRLDRIVLSCIYPEYTGKNAIDDTTGAVQPSDVIVQGTQVRLPSGTQFVLRGQSNKPIVSAVIQTAQLEIQLSASGLSARRLPDGVLQTFPGTAGLLRSDAAGFSLPGRLETRRAGEPAAETTAADPAPGAPQNGSANASPEVAPPALNSTLPLEFPAEADLQMTLTDTDGIVSLEPIRLSILSEADRPPELDLRLRGVGNVVTRQARIPVVGKIQDDYGVARSGFEYLVDSSQEPVIKPFAQAPGGRTELDVAERFELLPLDLKLGQKLSLAVAVQDSDVLTGPHEVRSERYLFTIVSNDELLAVLSTKELGLRPRFEQILEEIRGARKDLLFQRSKLAEARQLRAENTGTVSEPVTNQLQQIDETAAVAVERINSGILKNENELLSIEQAFRDLREEIENNALPDLQRLLERMDQGIIGPLQQVNQRDLKEIRDSLALLRLALQDKTDGVPPADVCLEDLEQTIQHMEAILAVLARQESVNEALQLLRDIIKLEKEVRDRTERERKRSLLE